MIGFIAVALLPSGFLLYVSESFLRADIDSWFNPEYKKVLDDSLDIAKSYYLDSANDALHFARVLAENIASRDLMVPERRADLQKFVEHKQQEYSLGTIEVFSPDRKLLVLALSPQIPTGIGVSPHSGLLVQNPGGPCHQPHRLFRPLRRNPRHGADLCLTRNPTRCWARW